jgi:hypothetical protein
MILSSKRLFLTLATAWPYLDLKSITTQRILYRVPFYPLLLGLYPVLYLWAVNYFQMSVSVIIRPLVLSMCLTWIAWLLCEIIFRDLRKASIAAVFPLALFFFYGHIYELIAEWTIFGIWVSRPFSIFGLWGLLFGIAIVCLVRTRSKLYNLTWILNLAGSFLLLMLLGQFVFFSLTRQITEKSNSISPQANEPQVAFQTLNEDTPDLYYILLDSYGREDLLRQNIGLDNHEFITQLEQMGFIVPACSQSNYNSTILAVASTFSMNYLDQVGFSDTKSATRRDGDEISIPSLEIIIQRNPVMQQFQAMGYQVITMREPFSFLNFPNSDIIYDNQIGIQAKAGSGKFEHLFARTTLLQVIIQEVTKKPEMLQNLPAWITEFIDPGYAQSQKYQLDLYQLNQLDQITRVAGKKFFYAHLLTTHPDFTFTPTGEKRPFALETKQAYAEQVIYTNQRILQVIKTILTQSKTPPIIILQGDHGYGGYEDLGTERFKILNAYYLPRSGKDKLYPEITPVNTFRLIFSEYFGMEYPFLPDRSIWNYEQVAGTCMK